jgi:hypothetical protein
MKQRKAPVITRLELFYRLPGERKLDLIIKFALQRVMEGLGWAFFSNLAVPDFDQHHFTFATKQIP